MAYNYESGDVIRFIHGSKQFALAKRPYARVETVDREANLLSIRTPEGKRVQYNPVRLFGVELFREEQRALARGERIQFRAPDRALGVANGEFATIKSIDAQRAVMHLDNGKAITAATDRLRQIDHGYASTSHSAQGATVDRVIIDIDTRLSPELVNQKQFYVSISRARNALKVYTDDRGKLGHAVSRTREKSMALDHTKNAELSNKVLPETRCPSLNQGRSLRR